MGNKGLLSVYNPKFSSNTFIIFFPFLSSFLPPYPILSHRLFLYFFLSCIKAWPNHNTGLGKWGHYSDDRSAQGFKYFDTALCYCCNLRLETVRYETVRYEKSAGGEHF
jgi:hypothetical protein